KADPLPKKYALLALGDSWLEKIRSRVKKTIAHEKLKRSGFFFTLEEDEGTSTNSAQSSDDLSLADLKEQIPKHLVREGTDEAYYLSRDRELVLARVYPRNAPSDFTVAIQFRAALERRLNELHVKYPKIKVRTYGPYRKRLDEYNLVLHDVNFIGW